MKNVKLLKYEMKRCVVFFTLSAFAVQCGMTFKFLVLLHDNIFLVEMKKHEFFSFNVGTKKLKVIHSHVFV